MEMTGLSGKGYRNEIEMLSSGEDGQLIQEVTMLSQSPGAM
jgi:hypothetical protein